jgi:predicted ribosome quality control (RQC) complex YloA/Tae2 family protein
MEIILDLKKSVEQNAGIYFEESKKARKKSERANLAILDAKKRLEILKKKEAEKEKVEQKEKEFKELKKQSQKWYHKFRWFISSDDFLVIGGRDSTTNEIVIKKQTEKDDIVFHTEMPASPFVVIKTEGKKVPDLTLKEAAEFTATYSSAWKRGISTIDVFYVNPDQVSKEAMSGEYISKGAFMIYGKKNFIGARMNLAVGIKDLEIIGGPISAVKKYCDKFVEIIQGDEKTSDVAKKIQKKIDGDLDGIIRVLPQGCRIK